MLSCWWVVVRVVQVKTEETCWGNLFTQFIVLSFTRFVLEDDRGFELKLTIDYNNPRISFEACPYVVPPFNLLLEHGLKVWKVAQLLSSNQCPRMCVHFNKMTDVLAFTCQNIVSSHRIPVMYISINSICRTFSEANKKYLSRISCCVLTIINFDQIRIVRENNTAVFVMANGTGDEMKGENYVYV